MATLGCAGCVGTLDGHSKAGVPFVKDTIEGRYERPADKVVTASKEVIGTLGTMTGDDTVSKTVEGKVNTRSVWVRVEEIDPKVSRVLVQCRTKGGGADVGLASEINTRIALWLTSHP